jgi:hypothetical protein
MFGGALMFDDLIDDIMMIISNSNIFWIGICWIMGELSVLGNREFR